MTYSNLQIFTVELIGTFILVVFATGSIVYDVEFFDGNLGIPFAAVAPFIALLIGVYSFGKISLAHFNPAVTIGYYVTGHITNNEGHDSLSIHPILTVLLEFLIIDDDSS